MTTYSAFFSSGLLSPPEGLSSISSSFTTPSSTPTRQSQPPSSPMLQDSPSLGVSKLSYGPTTPTSSSSATTTNATPGTTQRLLRKRRSSLTLGVAPLVNAGIRSPLRSARSASIHMRFGPSSPSSSTFGSFQGFGLDGEEGESLMGRVMAAADSEGDVMGTPTREGARSRSGSLGNLRQTTRTHIALRPLTRRPGPSPHARSKSLAYNINKRAAPSMPPPSVPLPAIPLPSLSFSMATPSKKTSTSPSSSMFGARGQRPAAGRPRAYSVEHGYAIDEGAGSDEMDE